MVVVRSLQSILCPSPNHKLTLEPTVKRGLTSSAREAIFPKALITKQLIRGSVIVKRHKPWLIQVIRAISPVGFMSEKRGAGSRQERKAAMYEDSKGKHQVRKCEDLLHNQLPRLQLQIGALWLWILGFVNPREQLLHSVLCFFFYPPRDHNMLQGLRRVHYVLPNSQ